MAKILRVNDEAGLIRVYWEVLSEEGYEIIVARDGKEALALLSAENPGVRIMNTRIPNMDGLETLVALLGKDNATPVVPHSADPEYKDNFITGGAEAPSRPGLGGPDRELLF